MLLASQVQFRRFFSFSWAFEQLDREWTGRLLATQLATASIPNPGPEAAAAGDEDSCSSNCDEHIIVSSTRELPL
jgi:hypothetical protein